MSDQNLQDIEVGVFASTREMGDIELSDKGKPLQRQCRSVFKNNKDKIPNELLLFHHKNISDNIQFNKDSSNFIKIKNPKDQAYKTDNLYVKNYTTDNYYLVTATYKIDENLYGGKGRPPSPITTFFYVSKDQARELGIKSVTDLEQKWRDMGKPFHDVHPDRYDSSFNSCKFTLGRGNVIADPQEVYDYRKLKSIVRQLENPSHDSNKDNLKFFSQEIYKPEITDQDWDEIFQMADTEKKMPVKYSRMLALKACAQPEDDNIINLLNCYNKLDSSQRKGIQGFYDQVVSTIKKTRGYNPPFTITNFNKQKFTITKPINSSPPNNMNDDKIEDLKKAVRLIASPNFNINNSLVELEKWESFTQAIENTQITDQDWGKIFQDAEQLPPQDTRHPRILVLKAFAQPEYNNEQYITDLREYYKNNSSDKQMQKLYGQVKDRISSNHKFYNKDFTNLVSSSNTTPSPSPTSPIQNNMQEINIKLQASDKWLEDVRLADQKAIANPEFTISTRGAYRVCKNSSDQYYLKPVLKINDLNVESVSYIFGSVNPDFYLKPSENASAYQQRTNVKDCLIELGESISEGLNIGDTVTPTLKKIVKASGVTGQNTPTPPKPQPPQPPTPPEPTPPPELPDHIKNNMNYFRRVRSLLEKHRVDRSKTFMYLGRDDKYNFSANPDVSGRFTIQEFFQNDTSKSYIFDKFGNYLYTIDGIGSRRPVEEMVGVPTVKELEDLEKNEPTPIPVIPEGEEPDENKKKQIIDDVLKVLNDNNITLPVGDDDVDIYNNQIIIRKVYNENNQYDIDVYGADGKGLAATRIKKDQGKIVIDGVVGSSTHYTQYSNHENEIINNFTTNINRPNVRSQVLDKLKKAVSGDSSNAGSVPSNNTGNTGTGPTGTGSNTQVPSNNTDPSNTGTVINLDKDEKKPTVPSNNTYPTGSNTEGTEGVGGQKKKHTGGPRKKKWLIGAWALAAAVAGLVAVAKWLGGRKNDLGGSNSNNPSNTDIKEFDISAYPGLDEKLREICLDSKNAHYIQDGGTAILHKLQNGELEGDALITWCKLANPGKYHQLTQIHGNNIKDADLIREIVKPHTEESLKYINQMVATINTEVGQNIFSKVTLQEVLDGNRGKAKIIRFLETLPGDNPSQMAVASPETFYRGFGKQKGVFKLASADSSTGEIVNASDIKTVSYNESASSTESPNSNMEAVLREYTGETNCQNIQTDWRGNACEVNDSNYREVVHTNTGTTEPLTMPEDPVTQSVPEPEFFGNALKCIGNVMAGVSVLCAGVGLANNWKKHGGDIAKMCKDVETWRYTAIGGFGGLSLLGHANPYSSFICIGLSIACLFKGDAVEKSQQQLYKIQENQADMLKEGAIFTGPRLFLSTLNETRAGFVLIAAQCAASVKEFFGFKKHDIATIQNDDQTQNNQYTQQDEALVAQQHLASMRQASL